MRTVNVQLYKFPYIIERQFLPKPAKKHICVDFALILATELLRDLPVSWERISFSSAQSTVYHQAKLRLSL